MGIVTVIASGKGGVGKSTVTVGLGTALAARGQKVLLIDADSGLRTLDFLTGISKEIVYDISDVISGNCEVIKGIYRAQGANNLFVLPAPSNHQYAVSPGIMRQLVSILSGYYHHILIDCPAGIGRGFQAGIAAAKRALVVSTPDPICLKDAAIVRQKLNENKRIETRLVINRFSKLMLKKSKVYADLDAVIDACGIQLAAVIPEDSRVTIAAAKGQIYSGNNPMALAFARMAARMEGERKHLAVR